ncbi:UDP-N-glucosamine 1-carboxyvinyltransferase [Prochlorococcus marinus str. MIT 9313]|uniref:UDP-N-acetylglucosamine 1-carboxyvinyltransferase n=1 Tax=Prochlorococcus marinus (strain MIT 9313) TaxID=74547 RepID=MURA_PROMM|nr:UDP-N-acetylglucosamine 1-carboxyvinyltransferase [Prochlorococcus marinus]Q7V8L0.1 RecName: Full=UDP-N-acetylglucosamine 1-carboxyvinyltransferase; AltName: Full=Enoylpyruvate transferase; AltName: Full=UDP-N-acetylglucosamine enolpyruvyl transferase; Short=EPT [Prochlorococcus marinus str. MIT 9313]CAE20507.1 UDP-N-glucosamine 1-carboxyvinyltransferase [Prochlorococcus marinus str. MIT 9313]
MPAAVSISQEILKPHLEIQGGHTLSRELKVSGAKNSALVLMTSALLSEGPLELHNVPQLTDIQGMADILASLGVRVKRSQETVWLQADGLHHAEPPYDLVNGLRASFFCIGPLLGRLGHAKVPLPGGCRIGARPVVEHIRGLKALGAMVKVEHGVVTASVPGTSRRLKGAAIVLDCPSVGATETILMAAVLAEGTSTIENAAQEPEVQDLAKMLNAMGARVSGAGGPIITIEGVERLHGCNYSVIPDRIEAGTFLIAAAITRSIVRVSPVIPEHLNAVLQKLRDCGCTLEIDKQGITLIPGDLHGVDIITQPFPGFPTDLQAPFMALLTTAKGTSVVTEKIYENRMQHVAELQRMGASIRLQGNTAVVEGIPQLSAAPVSGNDLRAAAALVLAGLAAHGISQVDGLNHLDRGYDEIETKLNASGAHILRHQPSG